MRDDDDDDEVSAEAKHSTSRTHLKKSIEMPLRYIIIKVFIIYKLLKDILTPNPPFTFFFFLHIIYSFRALLTSRISFFPPHTVLLSSKDRERSENECEEALSSLSPTTTTPFTIKMALLRDHFGVCGLIDLLLGRKTQIADSLK
ncbi:hypothetical protein CHUAL_002779 [Chamberlinius hualienensis]